jgi:hypothetical protein
MATDRTSGWRRALHLLVLLLVLLPGIVPLARLFDGLTVAFDAGTLVRLAGPLAVIAVLALLVAQKRRSRGREVADPPDRRADREIEGTGEAYAPYAYNEQQRARREGERIQERAAEIAEADRERRDRR